MTHDFAGVFATSRKYSSGLSPRLHELGEDRRRNSLSEVWISFHEPGDIGQVLQPFAGPPGAVFDRPDLPLQDVLDPGDGQREPEHVARHGARDERFVVRVELNLDSGPATPATAVFPDVDAAPGARPEMPLYSRRHVENIYFALTEAFNRDEPTVVLASGQAVVYHRVAIMSKDGDWIIRETSDACDRVRRELARRGARYRLGAPLDVRWLSAGWSSHFELYDEQRRRVRCDFVSRPPRVPETSIAAHFTRSTKARLDVVDIESLILMKQTQRAKDYAVIAELAARLAPEREIEYTTDPDRIMALARMAGLSSQRRAVRAALDSGDRRAVVLALAEETDQLQLRDAARVERYQDAARPYLSECRAAGLADLPLEIAHTRMCAVAEELLPTDMLRKD